MSPTTFCEKNRSVVSFIFSFCLIALNLVIISNWEHTLMAAVLFAIGCVLVGIASLGRIWCTLYISGYKNHTLVTLGPYSMCRNPLYFFSFLGGIGVGFATETFTFPILIGIGFGLYYPAVIRSEESRLSNIHGERFEIYRRQTPSFFPNLKQFHEPDEYHVRPKIFRTHIFYALWFIWILGILELLESFHEFGMIPTLFSLN